MNNKTETENSDIYEKSDKFGEYITLALGIGSALYGIEVELWNNIFSTFMITLGIYFIFSK